jgi:succinylglutamate desuccinylase
MENLKRLIEGKSFLELTRENEDHINFEKILHREIEIELHDTGIISFVPKCQSDTALVLSCGVHGNETAPIEICDEIISGIFSGKLMLAMPTLFLLGNPKGMNAATRFIDFNLNRLFCSNHKNVTDCYETKRAKILEESVDSFFTRHDLPNKLHYDLHTAIKRSVHEKFAIYPYIPQREYDHRQINILARMGIEAMLFAHSKVNTFSHHTAMRYGAEAFTVELGKVQPFGQNDMSKFEAAKSTLIELVTGASQWVNKIPPDLKLFIVKREIIKQDDSFKFSFDDATKNFTSFKKGEVLYSENGEDFLCEQDGLCIVFPLSTVEIGQRTGILVYHTDKL